MSEVLDPRGDPVELGRITVRGRGVSGTVESHLPRPGGVRASMARIGIEDLLDEQEFREVAAVEMTDLAVVESRRARVSRGERLPPSVEIEVAAPSTGWEQVVLTRSDDGVYSWSFAERRAGAAPTRAGGSRIFRVEVLPDRRPSQDAQRGLVGGAVRRVAKVLAFKAGATVGEKLIAEWEEKHRRHCVREFLPGSHREPAGSEIDAARWAALGEGPTLLFIHGTHSRCSTAFNRFPDQLLKEIHERYGRRVIAFDHPTLSVTPAENVEEFLRRIPPGVRLEVDIICHSRGGLVARMLSERDHPNLKVNTVAFVATPNSGTALADSKNLKTFLDAYTNFLSLVPGIPVIDYIDSVFTVAKGLGVGIHSALEGLQSMAPGGAFLSDLNRGPKGASRYLGVAANFEPANRGMMLWAADKLFDAVFDHAENDLIVPTGGVFGKNESGYFPIDDHLILTSEKGIHHSGFFDNGEVLERLGRTFTGESRL